MKIFLELMRDVRDNGDRISVERTGRGTRSVNGRMLRFNLADGFPILTTRKVPLRIAFEETMFFLRGDTQTKKLEDKNIHIWSGNTTREFLDNRNLTHLEVGDMGKGYGFQMRNWETVDAAGGLIQTDQISDLIDGLKADPSSRRHIVTHWNPGQLDQMALPPCHLMHMYSVRGIEKTEGEFTIKDGKLNSCFIMRSNDVYHGLPFNIMGYALKNMMFAKLLGVEPGELVYFGWDVHLYEHQIEVVDMQLQREPKTLPKLLINKDINSLEDILSLEFSDLVLDGYDPHPALPKVDMAV